MHVPSYQMRNVLNVYSKQLRQNMTSGKKNTTPESHPADRVNLMPEGKRRATIEKVSKDIFDKIARFGSLTDERHRITDHGKPTTDKEAVSGKTNKTTFVFNAIDTINKKRTNMLSVEDSSFLIQQVEKLSKEAWHKKVEFWI